MKKPKKLPSIENCETKGSSLSFKNFNTGSQFNKKQNNQKVHFKQSKESKVVLCLK